MKLQTEDPGDIAWMRNPDGYEAGDTIKRIKDAGKWDEFLELHQDADGVVDCDALYDYLRFESGCALLDVGMHETEATVTPAEVLDMWEKDNAPRKVNRDANGTPTGFQIAITERHGGTLYFESRDEDGEMEDIGLDDDEVLELAKTTVRWANNATVGEWDCDDVSVAEFEMWRGR